MVFLSRGNRIVYYMFSYATHIFLRQIGESYFKNKTHTCLFKGIIIRKRKIPLYNVAT